MKTPVKLSYVLRLLVIVLACCQGMRRAHAQVDQGAISSIVTDSEQHVIPAVTVTIVNQATNLTFTRQTGQSGTYTFTPIKVSHYNTTQYDVRVDYNATAKDQAFARYSYSNNPTTYTPPV